MKKHLLILFAFVGLCSTKMLADNYINVTNIPAGTAGQSLSVSIQYTSDTDRGLIYSIYSSTSDGNVVDWDTQWAWVNNEVTITAGTDVVTDISINLPNRLNSDDLDEGINYLLVLEFDDYSVGSYDGNIMSIAETTDPYTWAELTSEAPSTIALGETVTLDYRYRTETDSKFCLKVAVAVYSDYTWVADKLGYYEENFDGQPTAGYITGSYDLTIPEDFILSADLTAGQRYVIEVGMSGENWAWIGISNKYELTVEGSATGIDDAEAEGLRCHPNPTSDLLSLDGIKIGETISIYSVTGALVKTVTVSSSPAQISVSDLAKGLYIVKTSDATVKFIKQ